MFIQDLHAIDRKRLYFNDLPADFSIPGGERLCRWMKTHPMLSASPADSKSLGSEVPSMVGDGDGSRCRDRIHRQHSRD
jgi:hypothetical protein